MTKALMHHSDPGILESLHGILTEEICQYESTVEKLTHKSEMLIANQPQQLAQIDRDLLALSRKASQLEKQRQEMMLQLSGGSRWTLNDLITRLQPEQASRFKQNRERLLQAVQQTAQCNRDNRDLLDLSLRWIQETVEIIANAVSPEGACYTAQGGKNANQNTNNAASSLQSTISCSA